MEGYTLVVTQGKTKVENMGCRGSAPECFEEEYDIASEEMAHVQNLQNNKRNNYG